MRNDNKRAHGTIERMIRMVVLLLVVIAQPVAHAAISAVEREVLLDFYAHTHGEGWRDNSGWGGAPGTECRWHGVKCDPGQQHVVELNLEENGLAGVLPPLGALTRLVELNLIENRIGGPLPDLDGLVNLKYLGLYGNQFSGPLPDTRPLKALEVLDLAKNRLTGRIPDLAHLRRLERLFLSDNQLEGAIPALVGLKRLKGVWVSNNRLTGPVPQPPPSLLGERSNLCGNRLDSSGTDAIDHAWRRAQTSASWEGGVEYNDWRRCQQAP